MKENFYFSREAIVEYILDKCLDKEFTKDEVKAIVEEIVDELLDLSNNLVLRNEKSTYIIRKYFGIFDNGIYQSILKIAKELGVTRQNIDIIINKTFEDLNYEISLRKTFFSDIYKLKLSARTRNAIIASNIYTIEQFLAIDRKMLRTIINIGETCFNEIIEKVHALGYKFADEVEINKDKEKVNNINISRLKLSNRAYNCLYKAGISTIEQLISIDMNNLIEINSVGSKVNNEIIEKVHALGYKFADEIEINKDKEKIDNININRLKLSNRTYNCLYKAGISTLEQLISIDSKKLIEINNLGPMRSDEIIEKVHALGYKFADEIEINKNIDILKLSNRAYNCLYKAGISTLEQLISIDMNNLIEINSVGSKVNNEIIEKVHTLGYKFINEVEDKSETNKGKLNLKLSDIDLSVRTFNTLSRAGIFTLDQLTSLSKEEIIVIRNLRKFDYDEIVEKIHKLGYGFADEVEFYKNSLINQGKNLSELLKKCKSLQDERLQLQEREKEIDKELNEILESINEKVKKVGK